MTEEKDERLLTHIRSDLDRIANTLAAHDPGAFRGDVDVQDAVLQRLYRISDAASQLSDTVRSRYPDAEWDAIRGFRNVMAHGYLRMNLDAVEDIIDNDLDGLRSVVERELSPARALRKDAVATSISSSASSANVSANADETTTSLRDSPSPLGGVSGSRWVRVRSSSIAST